MNKIVYEKEYSGMILYRIFEEDNNSYYCYFLNGIIRGTSIEEVRGKIARATQEALNN